MYHLKMSSEPRNQSLPSSKYLAALVVLASSLPLAAQTKPMITDPLLKAMQQELDRERDLLLLPNMQRPYFIEYRLDDYQTYEAVANFGALTEEQRQHQRIVRVTVRIGDYTSDSSSSRGDGSVELAPEDNDPAALRYALWTTTDEAYKLALRAYATKQAQLKRFEKPPTEKDFSAAKPTVEIEPMLKLEINAEEWKKRLIDASGAFMTDPALRAVAPQVQFSSARLNGIVVNRFIVNTEGTVVRHGYSGYSANYDVNGQADDGMRLERDNGSSAATADKLESAAAFHKRAIDDVKSFAELRAAPLADAEDFHGPVLFSGDAATDVLNRLFVPNVEADRPEMGTTARTMGAYQSSYKARVLPEILNVVDDPRETTVDGHSVVGAYQVDDEGVPAQAVQLVDHGKLMNYLIGRTPVRDFPSSNGHGRAAPGQGARAAAGVMIFKAVTPVPAAEMHQKLVAMAREQDRDVYEVETLGGELVPRVLYRVHPDGTRQLIRGAVFDELDNRSLRSDIVAAGNDPYVNNVLGPIPQTTVAPSLLFGDIGVKRAAEEQQKLPYYTPPEPSK
jgi:TldD protein